MPDVDWEGKRRSGRLEGALCEPDGGEGIMDQGEVSSESERSG